MSAAPILLKNGTLLIHDEADRVVPTKGDLLIHDKKIAAVGGDIRVPDNAQVIDYSDKIVSPGFIDTHRHVWQTQLKGRHADQTLLQYFSSANGVASAFEPEDVFWGQLAGSLESIDAGTTTVLDHSHIVNTPEHAKQALNGTIASGIRSIYCYTPTILLALSPFSVDFSNTAAPWVMDTFDALCSAGPFSEGRVSMGFGFEGLSLPGEVIKYILTHVRAKGAKVITSHGVSGTAMFGQAPSALQVLDSHALLGPDILISHATPPGPGAADLLASSGAHISCTPSTELMMGHGQPIGLDPAMHAHASLGVDCHSATSAFLPTEMRALLYSSRSAHAAKLEAGGQWHRAIKDTHVVEKVFNLGTVLGARALGMETEIGRIAVGFKADLVIWDANSPGMLAAAVQDPVAAVVLHASLRDVEGVIVDGVVRKAGGKLVGVVAGGPGVLGSNVMGGQEKVLGWEDVAGELLRSRAGIDRRVGDVDYKAGEDGIVQAFHMNQGGMLPT